MRMRLLTNGMAVGAAALAITAGACNTADRNADMNDAPGTVGTSGEAKDSSPMTVTGCLQQGDGRDGYILTQVNEQPGPVATSGERESNEVQQKQQQAAAKSYRLSGETDHLRDLVGHEVRVTGNIADRGDMQERAEAEPREGDDAREIDQDNLAELEVRSAQSVAETCGTAK
jgi:hypothetical protein